MKRFMLIDDEGHPVREVTEAWIDGYPVGDRLLEGVRFKITITPGNTFKAEVHPDDAQYFATLNQRKWLREVERFCRVNDLWSSTPGGDDDIVCEDPDVKPQANPKPIVVQTMRADQIVGPGRP